MLTLTPNLVLNTLIRHETLTIVDLAKEENIGLVPDQQHLQLILDELKLDGSIDVLNGANPVTYTITDKGIEQSKNQSSSASKDQSAGTLL